MTISAQIMLKSSHPERQERTEKSSVCRTPAKKFRDCLKVSAIDQREKDKSLFALIEEEEETDNPDAVSAMPVQLIFTNTPQDLQTGAITGALTPDLEALFEKTAAAMIVQTTTNETRTTLIIDNPQSLFYGTEITILEFSSAPKSFNIEIATHPVASASIEAHKAALMAAFQEGRFNFSIHRLETFLQQNNERPVFHRKESDADLQDHEGDQRE